MRITLEDSTTLTTLRADAGSVSVLRARELLPWIENVYALQQDGLLVVVLGRGSNTLITGRRNDAVYAIVPRGGEISIGSDGFVRADAGTLLPNLARFLCQHNRPGFEWMWGVPGTVGAAVAGNAGAHGREIADQLVDAHVVNLDTGHERRLDAAALGYAHRTSNLGTNDMVISARFDAAQVGGVDNIRAVRRKQAAYRAATQPRRNTLGSTFRRVQLHDGTLVSAGIFIEQAGLKGTSIGGAQISEKHANFILNIGGATAVSVQELLELMRQVVHEQFQVTLQEEIDVV